MNKETYQTIPPWVKHFLIHVVRRSALILVKWIDDVKQESKQEVEYKVEQ